LHFYPLQNALSLELDMISHFAAAFFFFFFSFCVSEQSSSSRLRHAQVSFLVFYRRKKAKGANPTTFVLFILFFNFYLFLA